MNGNSVKQHIIHLEKKSTFRVSVFSLKIKDADLGEVKCSLLIHFTVVLNFNGSFHNTPKVLVDSTVKGNSSNGVELYDNFLRSNRYALICISELFLTAGKQGKLPLNGPRKWTDFEIIFSVCVFFPIFLLRNYLQCRLLLSGRKPNHFSQQETCH